jgi:hypothetical protein
MSSTLPMVAHDHLPATCTIVPDCEVDRKIGLRAMQIRQMRNFSPQSREAAGRSKSLSKTQTGGGCNALSRRPTVAFSIVGATPYIAVKSFDRRLS